MKVLCIKNYIECNTFTSITIGKIYDAKNVYEVKNNFAYQSENPYIFNIPDRDAYNIQDDLSSGYRFYDIRLFRQLSDVRNDRINTLLH